MRNKPITETLRYRAYERIRPVLVFTRYYRIKFAIRRRFTDEPPF